MSGKQEVLQVYAEWRHALRNLKLPEKVSFFFSFFFSYWRFAPFPSAGFTQTTHSGRTDICEHLSRREDLSHKHYETFFFFFSSSKPSPRFIYLLAGWIWNTQESEACRFTSTETTLLRSEETLRRLGSARLKVVLVLIRAVRSRMDYMDSGMRYTPKTSVSYLLRWSSGGGSCWLNVVSPCLCFYLLPGWSVSWDVCVCVWGGWIVRDTGYQARNETKHEAANRLKKMWVM